MQYPLIAREGYPIIYTVCAIVLVCMTGAWLTRGFPAVCLYRTYDYRLSFPAVLSLFLQGSGTDRDQG